MLFICYPKCTTCKKAREWLVSNGVAFDERDIKADRPTRAELAAWLKGADLSRAAFSTRPVSFTARWGCPPAPPR